MFTVQDSLSVHCAGFAECTLYMVRCGKCRFRTGNFASEASYTTIGKFKQNFRNRFLKNFTKTKGSCDFLKYLMHKTMQVGKEDRPPPPPPQTPGNRVRVMRILPGGGYGQVTLHGLRVQPHVGPAYL